MIAVSLEMSDEPENVHAKVQGMKKRTSNSFD